MLLPPPDDFKFSPTKIMADNHGEGPSSHARPPSPSPTGSVIDVGTLSDAARIQNLENGDYPNDDDDTRSLSESIRGHIVRGGLRYHAYHAGKYAFPNDETEQYRDDLKHTLTLHLCDDRAFFAPVGNILESGAEVLDLGTGTGKWCMELADIYTESEFHGMDLSPIQPDWVPDNVMFVVDDIEHEAGWTYPENHFDFIHIRHTLHSIQDRKELWNRIYRHLKPGGWFEIQEFHYTAACDDDSCDGPFAFRDFLGFLGDGMAALGSDLHGILKSENEISEAGFQNVQTKSLKCPVLPWAKTGKKSVCGHMLRESILWGLKGLARRPFGEGLGWTSIQIEMFLVDVRRSMTEVDPANGLPRFHTYWPFHIIYGQKPMDGP
ncbi:unnamed protein product [Clonostachys solani]|uniref:Uncharacterized protein n=1 Tax=Clonostachys solani TaxID=160281 RepID=A0A9P0ELI0_9HYPO|nr:unnamed protein product [Clonostachys solani]